MEEKLIVKGVVKFMGIELPNVQGGFGEDKKGITDKHIAEIHEMKVTHVRELLNKNIKNYIVETLRTNVNKKVNY